MFCLSIRVFVCCLLRVVCCVFFAPRLVCVVCCLCCLLRVVACLLFAVCYYLRVDVCCALFVFVCRSLFVAVCGCLCLCAGC